MLSDVQRAAIAAVLAIAASSARAGGMFLPVQGVHSLELAGALVAGANDADALWLDPAGLGRFAGKGTQGLAFDVAYLYQPTAYTAAGPVRVTNQQPGEGLPSLAGAIGLDDQWVLAGGLTWKYAPTNRYPQAIGTAESTVPGPERYMSSGISGTQYVEVLVGAAYVVSPRLRVGATLQDLVTLLDLQITASGCPGSMSCAAGDASFDMPLEFKGTQAFAPSGSLGVQYDALPELTIGAVVQAPTRISDSTSLTAMVPASPVFHDLAVAGNQGTVSFWLPPSVRAGVQYHAGIFAIEAAVDVELWSMQRTIDLSPQISIGTFQAMPVSIVRDYKTSVATSIGGEVQLGVVRLGAGIGYETSAAPADDVTTLTIDAPKLLFGIGGGYAAEGWQIGGAASFVYQQDVDVTAPGVQLLEPLHDPGAPAVYVNGGTYHAFDVMAGFRLARRF
jgi:long-subunit fatty acid transport protein